MRIISGQYKGIPLVSFSAAHIRPTTDRVKESLFNIWRDVIEDSRAIDLFSGTGSLGLEALSRGAREVTFVDVHPKSLDILRQNLWKLKIKEGFHIVAKDVFKFVRATVNKPVRPFDVIFIDPPFTEKCGHDVMIAVSESSLFHPDTVIAIESSASELMGDDYGPLFRYDKREFGDKTLSFFAVKPEAAEKMRAATGPSTATESETLPEAQDD